MPDIRALIFDMDGVVVDSNPIHRQSWIAYNQRHGLATTDAMHSFMYGKRNDSIVRSFYGEHLTAAEVFAHGAAKEALYREMMRPVLQASLVPGIMEFMQRHRELEIGLGTNAEPDNVRFVLGEAGFAGIFGAIVDGHQVERAKPAPDIYLKVASLLGVAPGHCVVFEDSFTGVEAALAAGMKAIGIRTTHREFEGVSLAVDNFLDPSLEMWLAQG